MAGQSFCRRVKTSLAASDNCSSFIGKCLAC